MKGETILSWIWTARRGYATRRLWLMSLVLSLVAALGAVEFASAQPSVAASYVPIGGQGSSWVYPAMYAWVKDVQQFHISVDYHPTGSTAGRTAFKDGTADFGASEIPYGVQDGNYYDPPPSRGYAYIPDVAGGTTFMYNLNINGVRVTNLRLSGADIAGIFTNKITMWNDPQIKRDNPQLRMPNIPIVPVVRSDGSGATAQFTQWMIATEGSYWTAYCAVVGRNPCTQTSTFPVQAGTAMQGVPADSGVAGYVSQQSANGAIGYVEYSYAKAAGFPVAKVLNAAGYYTEPTPGHVAVSLLKAQINTDPTSKLYLTQDLSQVYGNPDSRTYELSSYSYLIIPTDLSKQSFSTSKGYTLGAFGQFLLCVGQSQVDVLGYSALPINLVERGFAQLRRIPGNAVPSTDISAIAQCHNPTFSLDGTNTLAKTDPNPPACDKQGPVQCSTPTGGAPGAGGGGGNGGGGGGGNGGGGTNTTGGNNGGGNNGGGTNTTGGNNGGGTRSSGGTQTCDPITGICGSTAGGTGGTNGGSDNGNGSGSSQALSDNPIVLAGNNGDGVEVTLMALAAGLLFSLGVGPPLISQGAKRRRQRRGIDDEFYDNPDRAGESR